MSWEMRTRIYVHTWIEDGQWWSFTVHYWWPA